MLKRLHKKMHYLLFIGSFLLFTDILFLNYTVLTEKARQAVNNSQSSQEEKRTKRKENVKMQMVYQKETVQQQKILDSCSPFSCIDLIRQATSSLSLSEEKSNSHVSNTSVGLPKEFYISFGSAQTSSDQWEDAQGLSAYIDSTKYGAISSVTFETTMQIPTANGKVYAQLYNATDAHPVWFSEVSMEGNIAKLVISSPIHLDQGNKLYKVQMKTTLRAVSLLNQARIHIITQ